jgi:2-keto-4-pentenoate hydratase/2-oxohepta-3-ene-1,7-dioic acid hydratase in catechol pathway
MRIGRLGSVGAERTIAFVGADRYVEIGDVLGEVNVELLSTMNMSLLQRAVEAKAANGDVKKLTDERIGSPITQPHQILCIGLNYADHAAESGMAIPREPIVFNKAPNTLVGPNDDVTIPKGSSKTDWEVELGIVVGKRCSYLETPVHAWDHIAGFVLVNDVSEREFQLERGGQWVKGKSCATFNPCGPWLATADEFNDVQDLVMWLNVNGERMQTGSTATMIFPVPYLIWYLSQFMVLEPGDLINTGTPPGVGMGKDPQRYLKPGDVMTLGIDHLGTQRQKLVPHA